MSLASRYKHVTLPASLHQTPNEFGNGDGLPQVGLPHVARLSHLMVAGATLSAAAALHGRLRWNESLATG